MHVLVVTDNFAPERNAPAIRTYEHCRRWVKSGAQVTVVTSAPNFPSGKVLAPYRNKLLQRESLDGVHVVRVWTYLAPNRAVIRRSIDFASFGVTGFAAGLFQRADVIMATSPQLLAGLAGRALALVKRKPWLLEVRDLWPDSIVALDMMRERHPLVRTLRAVENSLYRSAARIVTTNQALRERLVERGVPGAKVGVVPNGVDAAQFTPRPRPQTLLDKYGINDRFVVGYIGTQGLAHDLETVMRAAEALRQHGVAFLFVGDGAQHHSLMGMAKRMGLDNIRFVRSVAASEVPDHIACCDVLLAPLKRTPTLNGTMPSKIFEIAAMERPLVIGAEGIAADLVESHRAGLAVEPENLEALIEAIERLRRNPALAQSMQSGCRALADDFSRDKFAAQMLDEIKLAARIRRPLV
ncbi:MAG TPA: glycosyltransferase family 4 protein [Rhizomicrobium sp.]|jgi:glycosyltransferase involved in cell wall biosynthesis|nr:glycosyltransferase family 4 protein [Rhizomicrobium sp.]